MTKRYITNCVNSTARLIDLMTDRAKKISYSKFVNQIEIGDLKGLFPLYNWSVKKSNGLTLKGDYAVSFYQSNYNGKPCVYVEHSSIEYIFAEMN